MEITLSFSFRNLIELIGNESIKQQLDFTTAPITITGFAESCGMRNEYLSHSNVN